MWLVPSRRRITKLRNFLTSACNAETTSPGMVLVDKKDWADNEKEYKLLEQYHLPPGWKFVQTDAEGMGPKVREVWPTLKALGATWVGVLNDDHHIVTKHWDKILIDQLNGLNFLTTNDRWNAPQRAAGATIFSMPLMDAFGFPMFPPQIDHLGIDDVFEQIGRATGCWEVDMKVVVEHHHAFKNPDLMDDTHRKVYGSRPWQESPEAAATQKAFADWYQQDFPGVVERVRKLRESERLAELPSRNAKPISVPN